METKALIAALKTAATVADKRPTHKILGGVYLSVAEGVLTLRATDLDTYSSETIETDQKKGAAIVNARALYGAVKAWKGAIKLTLDEAKGVTVTGENGTLTIPALGAVVDYSSGFPVISGPSLAFALPSLQAAIRLTRFAVSNEEMRLQLQGALLRVTEGRGQLIATDGYRLSIADLTGTFTEFPSVLISSGLLDLIGAAKGDAVTLHRAPDHLVAVIGARTFACKLDERKFPDVDKVVRKDGSVSFSVNAGEWLSAVETVKGSSAERMQAVTVTSNGSLEVRAESEERGVAFRKLSTATANIPGFTGRFNAKYLAEAAKAAKNAAREAAKAAVAGGLLEFNVELPEKAGESVTSQIHMTASTLPAGVSGWKYVLMPMRI